ncbi:MAG: flippase-like domain-containing protein [Gemmatimonadota bacterium]|nr:MAG: flippase-like domain-containing protein [Gemmatimonadota bacterium]
MSPSIRRWALRVAQFVLTVAVTYFLFRSLRVSWKEVAAVDAAAWRPNWLPLLASFAVLLAVFAYLVELWSRMVQALGGPPLRLVEAFKIFFVANLGRYVPGKFWQLAGLAYLAQRRGVPLAVASAAAILGQLFSLGAAAAVAVIALSLAGKAEYPRELLPWGLVLLALVGIATTWPEVLRRGLAFAFRLGRSSGEPPAVGGWFGARWLGLYLPAWIGYGIAFGLLWSAFPALPRVFWPAAVGSLATAYFLGYAAIFAPAGIGVREGALALLLAPWVNAPAAAVLAVIARLWMTAAELLPVVGLGSGALWQRLRQHSGKGGDGD